MSLAQARRASIAPPITDAGRPLDAITRSGFESSFGRSFEGVRVHNDARAHDAARSLDARAYATGNHIVFGEGQYRPETAAGRGLIAHELAHSVQQTGLAMKANGPMPVGADVGLEAEADRAAAEVTAGREAPALSLAARPTAMRAPAAATAPAPGPTPNMPSGFSPDAAAPATPGANEVTVWLDHFDLPEPKGSGSWVQDAYDQAAKGGRLGVILLAKGSSAAAWETPSAWKEDSRTAEYLGAWLHRSGFKSIAELGASVLKAKDKLALDAETKTLLGKIRTGLSNGKTDVDHIVEKQLGGTSEPSNLQILTSTVNQQSGREAYKALKEKAEEFRTSSKDWKNVRRVAMRIKTAKVPGGVEDASVKLETVLRDENNKKLFGSEDVRNSEKRNPVYLSAGGVGETLDIKPKGESEIEEAGGRIVPGVRLSHYKRDPKGVSDTVFGDLDNRAMTKSGTKEKSRGVAFEATVAAAGPAPVAAPDADATGAAGEAAVSAPKSGAPAGVEHRELKLDKKKFTKLAFFYPYLSPGVVDSVDLDAKGRLIGTGKIEPSVKFLGPLDIRFGPEELVIVKPIDVAAMNKSAFMRPLAPMFRFTSGAFEIDLMKFQPSGKVEFTAGPAASPLLNGSVTATVEGGAFVATGKLVPGKIPGVTAAEGVVSYNSETGWQGSVSATSSAIPNSTTDVKLGFRDGKDHIAFFASGSIQTQIKEKANLKIGAHWDGTTIDYYGRVVVEKPLPLVERVELEGSYSNGKLFLTGTIKDFRWKERFAGDLIVHYARKDGEAGKFSGSVNARTIGQEKMDGSLSLDLAEDGAVSGKGEIAYQLTKEIKPKLGVEYTRDQKLRLFGEVAIANIPLTGEWPKKGGERKDILKGLGVKVPIPTPVPLLNAFFEVHGSFGVGYGIGPLSLSNITVKGEVWPLEPDPKVSAQLSASLIAPGYAELYGSIGAALGAEVAAGLLGVKGGLDLTAALRININAGLAVNSSYGENGFAFEAVAGAQADMVVSLGVALNAEIYGAYGLLSYTWTKPLASPEPRKIGPELKVTLGKLSYSKDKGIVWPSLDQIDYEPKEFSAMELITQLLGETKPVST